MTRKPKPRVKQVSVVLRYSSPMRQGPWKTLRQCSATGTALYTQLADHFKEIWPNGLKAKPVEDDYDYIGGP